MVRDLDKVRCHKTLTHAIFSNIAQCKIELSQLYRRLGDRSSISFCNFDTSRELFTNISTVDSVFCHNDDNACDLVKCTVGMKKNGSSNFAKI